MIAVEIDPELAERLRRLFAEIPHVEIVEADILQLALPSVPFRVFGNVPFALTSAILRRLLDDPSSTVWRADLLVQYEVARKRASMWPSTLASLRWLPWWKFCLVRHLSRRSFEPPPPVDAGMLSITRRTPPLVPPEQRARFARLLGVAFRRTPQPVGRSLTDVVSPNTWKRFARERGLNPAATATDLDVFDWVDLYRLVQSQPGRKM